MSKQILDQFYTVQFSDGTLMRFAIGADKKTSIVGDAMRLPLDKALELASRQREDARAVQVTLSVAPVTNDAIYRLYVDCGRMGTIDAEFRADQTFMERMLADEPVVYAYEVLGKHSEIAVRLNSGSIKLVTDDPTAVAAHPGFRGNFNPIEHDRLYEGSYKIDEVWAYDDEVVMARYDAWVKGTPYEHG